MAEIMIQEVSQLQRTMSGTTQQLKISESYSYHLDIENSVNTRNHLSWERPRSKF